MFIQARITVGLFWEKRWDHYCFKYSTSPLSLHTNLFWFYGSGKFYFLIFFSWHQNIQRLKGQLNLNTFQVSKKYLHSPKLWYRLLLCEWVNGWVRVCLVLPASWWWVVKEFIVCWYLEPRCTSHVGAEAQKLQKGLPCLGGASVAADGRTWEIGPGAAELFLEQGE